MRYPVVRCWKLWRHEPHLMASVDLGYEGFVTCRCWGAKTKRDYTLAR